MPDDMLLTMLGSLTWADWAVMTFLSVPPLLILYSKRVHGGRKVLWFVLTSLFSWLAYVPFIFMTRPKADAASGPSAHA